MDDKYIKTCKIRRLGENKRPNLEEKRDEKHGYCCHPLKELTKFAHKLTQGGNTDDKEDTDNSK